MSFRTGVVDYGSGNIFSVLRGLVAAGGDPLVVTSPDAIADCDGLVLPGVGAFADGMRNIDELGLLPALRDFAESGRPLLAICLGAELLMSRSCEFGIHEGLGIIPGEVLPIPRSPGLAVPHVGWSSLAPSASWIGTALEPVDGVDEFYFTHSFSCHPEADEHMLAWCDYGPHRLVAAVGRGSVLGCQFHPELSSHPGQEILRAFLGAVSGLDPSQRKDRRVLGEV